MRSWPVTCIVGFVLVGLGLIAPLGANESPEVQWKKGDRELELQIDGITVATYVFADPDVSHPYFKSVKTRSGIMVTRPHPPIAGVDADDHVGLHAGVWMSFGDIEGNDYWRLKRKTRLVEFTSEPQGGAGEGSFSARLEFCDEQDQPILECVETVRVTTLEQGYRLSWTSRFSAIDQPVAFGDQEEMGLGIRLATPLAVDRGQGGRIRDDAGRENGKEVWGKTVRWCDYAGPLDQRWVGITVCADTFEVGPCYAHARDYGFLAMNPFGRRAFTGEGEPSRVVVMNDRPLTLRYAVVVHETATADQYDPSSVDEQWRREALDSPAR